MTRPSSRRSKRVLEALGNLFVVFGAATLFLATVGIYGITAFAVGRRTGEMGIRVALGAESSDPLRLVLRQGLVQLVVGLGLGLTLASLLSRGMADAFFRVEPWDKGVFVGLTFLLLFTGLLATFIPARRAIRVDPMEALRYE